MKKFLALLFCCVILICCTACKNKTDNNQTSVTEHQVYSTEIPTTFNNVTTEKTKDALDRYNEKINENFDENYKDFNAFFVDSINEKNYDKKSFNNFKLYNTFKFPFDIRDTKKYVSRIDDGEILGPNSPVILKQFDSYFINGEKFVEQGILSVSDDINLTINDTSCEDKKFNDSTFEINFLVKEEEISSSNGITIAECINKNKYYTTFNSESADAALNIGKYNEYANEDIFTVDKFMFKSIVDKLGKPDKVKRTTSDISTSLVLENNNGGEAKNITKSVKFIYYINGSVIEVCLDEKQSVCKEVEYLKYNYDLEVNIYSKEAYNIKLNLK